MATIIMRIITFAMSISVFFTSAVPAYLSGEDYKIIPDEKINNTQYYGLSDIKEDTYCYQIISNYDEWTEYSEKYNFQNPSYTEQYFENNSLVIAEFTIISNSCDVQVISAAERNDTLELNCNIYRYYGVGVMNHTFHTITVETSKNIKTVDISAEDMTIPIAF